MTTRDEPAEPKRNGRGAGKKAYTRPRLVTYGDISRITRSVGNSGAGDGGMGMGMDKIS